MPSVPPIRFTLHEREPFAWCQVAYVYQNELRRQGAEAGPAIEEGIAVMRALEPHGSPTPVPADPQSGMVHWPSLICAANAYASLPIEQRMMLLEMMRKGTPAHMLPTLGIAGGCDRKVLDDSEYHPAPPCLPQQGVSTAVMALGAFGLTALAVWTLFPSPKP